MANNTDYAAREAEYRRDWINQHDKADEIVVEEATGKIVAAIYYYPPTHHEAEIQKIWRAIGASMEIERLKEYEDGK